MDPNTKLNNQINKKNATNKESKANANTEIIKNESNGIIKEEVNDNLNNNKTPNCFVINKQFMETENELINN